MHDGEISAEDRARLQRLLQRMGDVNDCALGYPAAKDFDFAQLAPFFRYPINNIGDPFAEGTYRVETRDFEREVVEFYARALHAPDGDWWGYVTNGGSEGNLYGLYLARELLPAGIVYYSEHTHYSVSKNLHFLGMRHIMIRAQQNGEIDYDDLYETLKIRRDVPPIVFANIGTTMTEARDDVAKIRELMDSLAIRERYIHADAALSGGYLPFVDDPPRFDFRAGADSVAISGHKFLGSPIPCGIVVAKRHNVRRIARSIDYIGSLDTTITGSRNGLSPLMLWLRLRGLGEAGLRERARKALDLAAYAERRLHEIGVRAWRNFNCLTVVFPTLPAALRDRWQLATQGDIQHLITVPGVTREKVDAFVADVAQTLSTKEPV